MLGTSTSGKGQRVAAVEVLGKDGGGSRTAPAHRTHLMQRGAQATIVRPRYPPRETWLSNLPPLPRIGSVTRKPE
jgi:hypothetical protein